MNSLYSLNQNSFADSSMYNLFNVDSNYSGKRSVDIPTVVLTALTTASICLATPSTHFDSSVSYQTDVINSYKTRTSLSKEEAILAFSLELYSKSRSMTDKESLFVKNMILEKAVPGISDF